MIYSTPEFIALLLLVVPAFRIAPYALRRLLLLFASVVFILWAGWITTLLVLAVAAVIWSVVRLGGASGRRLILVQAGISLLACNLLFWKYTTWILGQLGFGTDLELARFLDAQGLPIGISFYTLQGIAYLVDYYRGEAKRHGLLDFLLFESFFGQLIAGPIVRHDELMPQLRELRPAAGARFVAGMELFALGFFKKLVLADRAATYVDPVFANMSQQDNGAVLAAVLLYTVQIYGDFSGYTDMGRGSARMLGIELPENFDAPYLSTSIRQFWRRWHVTLGRWLRDFIYIPLGGNRIAFRRTLGNLAITMALCGLWHGAAWKFVLWGCYHGALMAGEHAWQRYSTWKPPRAVSIALTLGLVMFGWVLFRVDRLSDVAVFAESLLGVATQGLVLPGLDMQVTTLLLVAAAGAIQVAQVHWERSYGLYLRLPALVRGAAVGGLCVLAVMFRGTESPFIYFAF